MRFSKQRTKYDCGACVIINSVKWGGIKYSYRDNYRNLLELLRINETKGINPASFHQFLLRNKFPFKINKVKKNITINEIRQYLNENKAIIFGNEYKGFSHVGLIINITKKFIYVVNWGGKYAISKISIEKFKKCMVEWNVGYFIERGKV